MSIASAYTETLAHFGATPLVLPLFGPDETAATVAPLLALCDGFLLTGSVAMSTRTATGAGDVPEGGYCDERRDALDWAILNHADQTIKPVFGNLPWLSGDECVPGRGTLAWHLPRYSAGFASRTSAVGHRR